MRVRVVQNPKYPTEYSVQYKTWWFPWWRTYSDGLHESMAFATAKRLLNPLIVEVKS